MARRLSSEERRLWRTVTKTVRPALPDIPQTEELHNGLEQPDSKPLTTRKNNPGQRPKSRAEPPLAKDGEPAQRKADPARIRRVARERLPIEATLDLHGMTQDHAYTALQAFLENAYRQQRRTVLIITGKGKPRPGESGREGVLRRRFLQWAETSFRPWISSLTEAHQRHGGGGAFYVFIRKKKGSRL